MNNEEKILAVLEQLQQGQQAIIEQQNAMQEQQNAMQEQQNTMKDQLETVKVQQESMNELLEVHTGSITSLENSVTHQLNLLNENLPDALARREAFETITDKVDDHDNRIFALEQKLANG